MLEGQNSSHAVDYCYQSQSIRYAGKEFVFGFEKYGSAIRLTLDGAKLSASVIQNPYHPNSLHLFRNGRHQVWHYQNPLEITHIEDGGSGKLTAPMPGKVIAIQVKIGDKVEVGDPLIVVEAMKMEHTITAPIDGEVAEINYATGDQVAEGDQLIIFKAQE